VTERTYKMLVLVVTVPLCAVIMWLGLATLAGGSCSGTPSSGRTITVHADTFFMASEFAKDTATVTADRRVVVVRPDELKVDGVIVGAIDPAAMNVEVRLRAGVVSCLADGAVVKTLR
jgi:hypothetical protein